ARLHESVPALDLGEPEGTVAEGFHPPGELGRLPRRHRVRADPDAAVPDRACVVRADRVRSLPVPHRCCSFLLHSRYHSALKGALGATVPLKGTDGVSTSRGCPTARWPRRVA